jgi:hypothetical protein
VCIILTRELVLYPLGGSNGHYKEERDEENHGQEKGRYQKEYCEERTEARDCEEENSREEKGRAETQNCDQESLYGKTQDS